MGNNIVEVEGITEGDTFVVDGPMWYDGTAVLKKFNSNVLELDLVMKATESFGEIDFVIKDDNVNLSIVVDKPDEDYRLIVIDNYNNGAQLIQDNLKVEYGETEGGFFSKAKDYVKVSNIKDETTFTINGPGNISIKTTAMPVGVDLIKNK